MRLRYGVFATAEGWVVADWAGMERFSDLGEAMQAARRRAGIARWRGDEVEILAQAAPGDALAVVSDLAPEPVRF